MSLNINALVATLGAFHRENRDILISEILLDQSFQEKFEILDDVTDQVPLPSLALADLLRPANPAAFTPTLNALNFGARILQTRPMKVDLQIIPQIMEQTWLGRMKSSKDPFDMPFEAFIMQYIAQKTKENLHLQGLFRGIYNPIGVLPIDTMDGFLTLLALNIPPIVPVVTGVINAGNVIASLEMVYDRLGEAYKNVPTQMFVSPAIFDMYGRAYRQVFNGSPIYSGIKRDRVTLDGTLCEVVREPGLGASQRVICSPKDNFVLGVNTIEDYFIDIQKFDRTIKILIDLKAGVNFKEIHGRALAINDQP
jgi:hypothetical protein